MPATYTTSLRLTKPADGDINWGTTVNTGFTDLIDASVAGTTTITMAAADYTLTNVNGTSDEARRMFIVATGSPGAPRNVICPAVSKLYFFRNDTAFALTLKTSSGSGVSVPAGQYMILYCNGTNVVEAVNAFGTLTVASLGLTAALAATSGGTGQNTYAVGDLLYASSTTALSKLADVATGNALISGGVGVAPSYGKIGLTTHVSGTLATSNGGTGSATGSLVNCTVDGTNAVGFREIPQNSQSTNYTLVLSDSGKHIFHPSADTTARTFTIPANASVPFSIGTVVTFVNQNGAGVITISITSDTMRLAGVGSTGNRTLAANGLATAIKVTSTEWLISGTGLT